ncbi:MAG: AAA family ATPase, partial [Lachnospiraceae bacterium]|nr:AAA family ATPase [Lachnospiraceae bacterium]
MGGYKKAIPIGTEFFQTLREDDCYSVDKTGIIEKLLESKLAVMLFLRPRRFGKTLMLDMLKCFFEDTRDEAQNEARRALFTGLEVEGSKLCKAHQTRYPVVTLTLKSAKQDTWDWAYSKLVEVIAGEFKKQAEVAKYLNDQA